MCAGNDKLSGLCDLIPGLTTTPTAEQLQMIYGEYLNDFIKNPFEIDGMGVVVNKQKVKSGKNYDNFLLGKHETFCHVVSRNIDNSKKRTFDPNRANKVHWIKPILENSNDKRIKYFEGQNSKAQWCRFYWYKERSYIVILKEISCDLLLVTGYCVDLSEIDKFNKQWQNYKDQENIAKKNLPRR